MLVGLDLDNTIIDYDDSALSTAEELALLPPGFTTGKRGIRDALRLLPGGEERWQQLQAEIYGPRILQARPFAGVLDFLRFCADRRIAVAIVSHKTEFAAAAPLGSNLRDAARTWLRHYGIVGPKGMSEDDVHFVATRAEKLARIAALGCAIFIDDLSEVFAEPEFPAGVERWLFAPGGQGAQSPQVRAFRSWRALKEALEQVSLPEDASSIATRLSGEPVLEVRALQHAGRNSRLFRVRTPERLYALKVYPNDGRDRLSREVSALRFLRAFASQKVPAVVGYDETGGCALLEWIEGSAVGEPAGADVEQAARLLRVLHELRLRPEAEQLGEAMEACLSARDLIAQIARRRERLGSVEDIRLQQFLEETFDPALARAKDRHEQIDPDRLGPLARKNQTLSPSDFGFHNALRLADGTLAFLDFDYFGWDDPAKTVADFLLHPGMRLSPALGAQFQMLAAEIYGVDPHFEARLRGRFPLFALRWALIVLNEFVPAIWRVRRDAGIDRDWGAVKALQLEKALAAVAVADGR